MKALEAKRDCGSPLVVTAACRCFTREESLVRSQPRPYEKSPGDRSFLSSVELLRPDSLVVEVERDQAQRILALQLRLSHYPLRDDRIETLGILLAEPLGCVEGRLDGFPWHTGLVPARRVAKRV
jgi:hypothetical protein